MYTYIRRQYALSVSDVCQEEVVDYVKILDVRKCIVLFQKKIPVELFR